MNDKLLLSALALSALSANASPIPSPGAELAVPQRLVDIGGRRLALRCSGTGSPTVVFESPSGSAGWEWWRVRQAERVAFATDRAQLRAARKSFGDMPVIVLVRGVSPYLIPGKPQSDTNKAVEAANLELPTAIARSSTKGEVRVVAGAGHVIQATHPRRGRGRRRRPALEDQPLTRPAARSASSCRSTLRCSLPVVVIGSDGTNSMSLGVS